ncbi:MAG: hypothetical protein ACJ72Q_15090 [Nitrososphaeraceae archaeon]
MTYRCDHCNEYHDTSDLTINIDDEGHQVIDDITQAVMGIIEKRAVPYELLIYALAAHLEHTKQVGLDLGNKSHRIEMIIQVARNDVIDEEGEEKKK